jgi:hypothetical protein
MGGFERARLPRFHVFDDGVGDPRDQVRRDVRAVELAQVALDVTRTPPARVQREYLVVEPLEPATVLGTACGSKEPLRSRGT